jgi:protein-tyrosine-phosphatase
LKEFNGADKEDINIPDPYKTGKKRYDEILEIVEKNVEIVEKNVEALVKKVKRINQ